MEVRDGAGCRWNQRGNQTGHCSQCHRTFDSLEAFDRHQTNNDKGMTCHDPAGVVKENDLPWFESRNDHLTTYWKRTR